MAGFHLIIYGRFWVITEGTFKWFFPSRKDWAESRKAKRESKIDAKVLGALRTLCEGNSTIYGAEDVANRLTMTLDDTADSFERLESIGRVQRYAIGSSDPPGPGWRSKFR